MDQESIQQVPSLDLSIIQFQPTSLQSRLDEVLNAVENSLRFGNAAGCEVKYILAPEALVSESSDSSEEEEEEEWFPK